MKRTILSMMMLLGPAVATVGVGGVALANNNRPAAVTQSAAAGDEADMVPGARLAERLGLDAQQTTAVEQLVAKFKEQKQPLWQAQKATRESLQAELAKPTPDVTAVQKLTAQLLDGRQRMEQLRKDEQAELQRTLTPVQFARLVLQGHGRHGMGRGGMHRHGRLAK